MITLLLSEAPIIIIGRGPRLRPGKLSFERRWWDRFLQTDLANRCHDQQKQRWMLVFVWLRRDIGPNCGPKHGPTSAIAATKERLQSHNRVERRSGRHRGFDEFG